MPKIKNNNCFYVSKHQEPPKSRQLSNIRITVIVKMWLTKLPHLKRSVFVISTDNRVILKAQEHFTKAVSFLWWQKSQSEGGSSCILADKSHFENPLVTQWRMIITALQHTTSWLWLSLVSLAFFSAASLKISHETGKSIGRELSLMEEVGDGVFLEAIFLLLQKCTELCH